MKANAKIWPRLFYMCHIGSTAGRRDLAMTCTVFSFTVEKKRKQPLPSEYGTYKTVEAIFWL